MSIERHPLFIRPKLELCREIERLRAELANKDQILGDTLAVLCGDGGHYRAEHGDIKAKEHGLKRYHDLLVSEDGLRAELAEYRQDAERYRWLRDPACTHPHIANYCAGDDMDRAFDRVMGKAALAAKGTSNVLANRPPAYRHHPAQAAGCADTGAERGGDSAPGG